MPLRRSLATIAVIQQMTVASVPPRSIGPLARREARLAWGLLAPTLLAVALVVILPLLAVFWISVKPVTLAELRPPAPVVREDLRGRPAEPGDVATIRYRLRNSSRGQTIRGVTLSDRLPEGLTAGDLDPRCTLEDRKLFCDLGDWEGGFRDPELRPEVRSPTPSLDRPESLRLPLTRLHARRRQLRGWNDADDSAQTGTTLNGEGPIRSASPDDGRVHPPSHTPPARSKP